MDKFTKDQQVQAVYDLKVGYTMGHADIAMLKSMARQLLASMEQEPEGWQFLGVNGLWVSVTENGMRQALKEGCEVRPLYAAPQLPRPAVPDEIDVNAPALDTHRKWMAEGWNKCRAAMLQGKAELKLPDAIDTNLIEALRLVQCMLEDYRERNYGDAERWIRHINTHMSDYSESHGDDAYSVLHDLLPAAPRQEVK